MRVVAPREVFPGEQRVAVTPATAASLIGLGFEVAVQAGAGGRASYPDEQYRAAGADVVEDVVALWASADVVLKVCPPTDHPGLGRHEADLLPEGALLVCFIWPSQNEELLLRLAGRKANVYAMDQVPRVTRAQKMDALSSMAGIAGYRAVIEAASHFGRLFAGQITAAGKSPPATVLVIGAGVAGLAAIAAARGLGAVVRAFDTRAEAAEQIASLGAEVLRVEVEESGEGGGGYAKVMSPEFLAAEAEMFRRQAAEVDVVITTALIPGKPAPKLWEADMVAAMKPGSVVVDLASVNGGNCELTRPGEVVVESGVTIIGFEDLTSRMATTASQLYGTNIVALMEELGGAADFAIDLDNDVVGPGIVVHEGYKRWPLPRPATLPLAAAGTPASGAAPGAASSAATTPGATAPSGGGAANAAGAAAAASPAPAGGRRLRTRVMGLVELIVLAGLALLWWRWRAESGGQPASGPLRDFVQHITVFVLACFVGWQVIWNVTPALHTPLMAVTNAISGIIILGGLLACTVPGEVDAAVVLGALATLLAMINVAGGFLVTQRMLQMFRKG